MSVHLRVTCTLLTSRKRGSRGGDRGSGFVKGGVLCRGLMGRRGVQQLFLPYYYQFFSGSLRLPVLYKHITCIHASKFKVQYGTVILSLYFPYPNYEKNPTSNLFLYWKGIFILFLSRITRFYTIKQKKKFWGRTPRPPPRHIYSIYKLPCHLCVYVERGLQWYKRPCPTEK